MSEKTISKQLGDCLDWIEQTGSSIHDAASRFPDHTQELIPLLKTSEHLAKSEKISPTPEFKAAARTRLLNQIGALEGSAHPLPVTKPQATRHIWQIKTRDRRYAMRPLLMIGLIVILLSAGGGVVSASSDALPGDMLYPLKTGIQDVELALSGDASDIDLLLENMGGNVHEMQQLALQQRYSHILIGLEEYIENLQALTRTRTRLAYEDAGSEASLNSRIQLQLQTQAKLLEQLQLQTQEQLRLQERIQQAIQLTEQGHTYGPNEGGQPDEPGSPNGAGPGEPQGVQNGPGKPEDSGSGNGQADPGQGPGPGGSPDSGGSQNQNSYGDGDGICNCLEEGLFCVMGVVQNADGEVVDAVCTCEQTNLLCGVGKFQNQFGNGEGSSGNGQGGKP